MQEGSILCVVEKFFGQAMVELYFAILKGVKTAMTVRKEALNGRGLEFGSKKGDGRYDFVTPADFAAEKAIMSHLLTAKHPDGSLVFPGIRMMAEEVDPRHMSEYQSYFVPHGYVEKFGMREFTAVIDPVDCTAYFRKCIDCWGVSGALHEKGVLTGGCIIAPEMYNGLHVIGYKGKGVFFSRNGSVHKGHIRPLDTRWLETVTSACPLPTHADFELPSVHRGISMVIEKGYLNFLHHVSQITLPKETTACSVGLAEVACGIAHAYMHRPLPWYDLAAGVALVLAAGGSVQYYDRPDNQIRLLDKPHIFGETGFIAGHPDVVKWLARELQTHYNQDVLA